MPPELSRPISSWAHSRSHNYPVVYLFPVCFRQLATESRPSSLPSLPFPRHRAPSPFDIFHLPRSASTAEIKSRYYQLVKIYHPDVASQSGCDRPSSSSAVDAEVARRFKLIMDAYELLRSPGRRESFLRYGHGWMDVQQSPTRACRSTPARPSSAFYYDPTSPSSAWSEIFSRARRGGYYGASEDRDWFSSRGRGERTSSFRQQWERDGLIAKNGIFISSVGCIGLVIYIIQLWNVLPLVGSERGPGTGDAAPDQHQFRRFIEPEGDARLDQQAWARLKPIQFVKPTHGTPEPEINPMQVSAIASARSSAAPHSHPLSSSSFQNRIEQLNLESASNLRSARAAAVPPSHFSSRLTHPSPSPLPPSPSTPTT